MGSPNAHVRLYEEAAEKIAGFLDGLQARRKEIIPTRTTFEIRPRDTSIAEPPQNSFFHDLIIA